MTLNFISIIISFKLMMEKKIVDLQLFNDFVDDFLATKKVDLYVTQHHKLDRCMIKQLNLEKILPPSKRFQIRGLRYDGSKGKIQPTKNLYRVDRLVSKPKG